ncbi:MAG TPA: ABC transporter permease subunit, partial [Thermomicrobiales bacterium]|nr:ABC transporter permease subunit [Thermomicrobiales bacterium]
RWDSLSAGNQATFDAIGVSLTGVVLAQLIVSVLGVLIVTSEYSTGMIRASLAAVPRRLMLLTGKIVVSGAVALAASLSACFLAFLLGQVILGDHGVTLGSSDAMRAILGAAFYLTSISVIASAIGFIVRSTAGGIAATLGLLLVLPILGQVLPYKWVNDILDYLPSSAGMAIYSTPSDSTASISATSGVIALIVWMVVSIAGAAFVLVRRDA